MQNTSLSDKRARSVFPSCHSCHDRKGNNNVLALAILFCTGNFEKRGKKNIETDPIKVYLKTFNTEVVFRLLKVRWDKRSLMPYSKEYKFKLYSLFI